MKVFICAKPNFGNDTYRNVIGKAKFHLNKFIDMYKNKYDICFVKDYDLHIEGIPLISKDEVLNTKERAAIIWSEQSLIFDVPKNIYGIVLSYYSYGTSDTKYINVVDSNLRKHNIDAHVLNVESEEFLYPYFHARAIGDLQIDNIFYLNDFPQFDIVYFPNFAGNWCTLQNANLKKESRVVYNVLRKYADKYSVITCPHPESIRSPKVLNSFKFVNMHFDMKNDTLIKNAKVIINSCKSFIGLSCFFNKPLIFLKESCRFDLLPPLDAFVQVASYSIDPITEESLTTAIECALHNDTKCEVRSAMSSIIKHIMYDSTKPSPTERLEKIIEEGVNA